MEDADRLVTIDMGPAYVSPWGEPGRKSTTEKLLTELENYNYDLADEGLSIRRDMVKQVALMPQISHLNMIIFGAAVYVQYVNRKNPFDVPEYILTSLIDRLNKLEKRAESEESKEDSLTSEELYLAVKANVIRYIYIINEFLAKEHQIMDDGELDGYQEGIAIGEMDEFNEDVDPDLEFDPLEMGEM